MLTYLEKAPVATVLVRTERSLPQVAEGLTDQPQRLCPDAAAQAYAFVSAMLGIYLLDLVLQAASETLGWDAQCSGSRAAAMSRLPAAALCMVGAGLMLSLGFLWVTARGCHQAMDRLTWLDASHILPHMEPSMYWD